MLQAIRQAVEFHQQGRLADAERLYREALRGKPRDFEALHMLGILKLQQGNAAEAVPLIDAALKVDRRSAAAHCNRGLALAALQRHDEALASFDRALAISPRNADAHASRADTLCDLRRHDEALEGYNRALALDPKLVSALVNRGVLLRDLGRPDEALASYDAALAIDANDAAAWNNRGVVQQELGLVDEALISFERALVLWPDYIDALLNRGNLLVLIKRPADAMASYARALALNPNHADASYNAGNALFDLGRFTEAVASYDRAVVLRPNFPDAGIGRARALEKLDRHGEATAEYAKLRETNLGDTSREPPSLLIDLIHCHANTCNWANMGALREELGARVSAGVLPVDPFVFLGFEATAEQQFDCARHWTRLKKLAGSDHAWTRADFPSDRIRIAYLSADYHSHATAYLMAELFELHDRRRFEIIGVSFGPDDKSQVRSRLIKSFDRFFDVTTRSTESVVRLLRNLNVGIAVDLKGHTTHARTAIFGQRVAPIQVSYLGYPGTSGAQFMDYIIADPIVLPFDQQPFYAEKIVHLPDSYQVNDSKRPIAASVPSRAAVGLPDDGFVFCCFNNSWKINARMFDVWMRLLHAVEGSVLWLLQANALVVHNLRQEAQARGIDPTRLVFAPLVDLPDHLARHKLADLCLDTLPYNAHTTASDALWAGVPVVTCRGETFAGRVAASLLAAVGLAELVTTSLEDYEALGVRLAQEPARLRVIRQRLADNRSTHPLFDADRFRRHIEAAYLRMWETWQRGDGPQGFGVDPIHE